MSHFVTQLLELVVYLAAPALIIAFAFFFSVLLHELGHAIPMLLMSSGKVEVYVGSFGDSSRSIKSRIARLTLFFKYNPLLWRKGICKPPPQILTPWQRILYTATGPVASILLGAISWFLLSRFEMHGMLKLFVAFTLFTSLACALSSVIPKRKAFITSSGQYAGNDAAQIMQWFTYRKLPSAYWRAAEYNRLEEYSEAAALLDKLLAANHTNAHIYRAALFTHIKMKDYAKAARINEIFKSQHEFDADDYCNDGFIKSKLDQFAEGMPSYEKTLSLNPNHIYALNNMGYSLCIVNRHSEAIVYFDKILTLSPNFSHAYDNRGWAKINMGNLEEGLADVNHSLTLEKNNADAYRNIGLYHLKKQDFSAAIESLEKAKAMEGDIPLINEYLAEAFRSMSQVISPAITCYVPFL